MNNIIILLSLLILQGCFTYVPTRIILKKDDVLETKLQKECLELRKGNIK